MSGRREFLLAGCLLVLVNFAVAGTNAVSPQKASELAMAEVKRQFPTIQGVRVAGVSCVSRVANRRAIPVFRVQLIGFQAESDAATGWQTAYVLEDGAVLTPAEFDALFPVADEARSSTTAEATKVYRIVLRDRPLEDLLQVYGTLTGKSVEKRADLQGKVEFVHDGPVSAATLAEKLERYLKDRHRLEIVPLDEKRVEVRALRAE